MGSYFTRNIQFILPLVITGAVIGLFAEFYFFREYKKWDHLKSEVGSLERKLDHWIIRSNEAYFQQKQMLDLKDVKNLYLRDEQRSIQKLEASFNDYKIVLQFIDHYSRAHKSHTDFIKQLYAINLAEKEISQIIQKLQGAGLTNEIAEVTNKFELNSLRNKAISDSTRYLEILNAYQWLSKRKSFFEPDQVDLFALERRLKDRLHYYAQSQKKLSSAQDVFERSLKDFQLSHHEIMTESQRFTAKYTWLLFGLSALIILCLTFFISAFAIYTKRKYADPLHKITTELQSALEMQHSLISNIDLPIIENSELGTFIHSLRMILKRMKNQAEALSFLSIESGIKSHNQSFMALTAREIRTPLNSLTNIISQLCKEFDSSDSSPLKEDIRNLHNASVQILSLVNQILDYNRIQEGTLQLRPTSVSLKDQINTVVEIYTERFNARQVSFRTIFEGDDFPPVVFLDSVRFNQILFSLLRQSWKKTARGSVTLRFRSSTRSPHEIKLQVSISDTGDGYIEDELDRLLTTESQEIINQDSSLVDLYMARNILNYFSSNLIIESEESLGTHVSFEMKIESKQLALHPNQNMLSQLTDVVAPESVRVLVVDDNKVNLRLTAKILEQAHYKCEVANNAIEALEFIKKNIPLDLILLDLEMPGMDGLQFCQFVRESNYHTAKTVPIIALTASNDEQTKDDAFIIGMNDFISKPFTPIDLLEIINKNLNLAKQFGHSE